jgi:hypothetical protein
VIKETADFVHGQLGALQPQLKTLFEAGMTFFRFATRLRYLRGYCDLSLETRRAWTRRWMDGRFSLLRQLFKPIRVTALLGYYENRAVQTSLIQETRLVRDKRATASKKLAPSPDPTTAESP